MIATSNYANFKFSNSKTYSISGDRGKKVGYLGRCYPALAPKYEFWIKWYNARCKVSADENNKYYISEFYKKVLADLDPEDVYRELENSILLCYEDSYEFCHRHIVSAWFELFLGKEVPEIINDGEDFKRSKRPEYIKAYLEEVIKRSINMHGFKSIRAAYLFEKGEKLEERAEVMESKDDYQKESKAVLVKK